MATFIYHVACILQVLVLLYLEFCVCSVIVDSPFGKIKGEVIAGDNEDQSSVVFRNIPYAKPPVGQLRFAKPEPHPKIDGIFDATDKRVIACPQTEMFLVGYEHITEDCLILSIYAKNIYPSTYLKKVIVYIHGGGFIGGSSGIYNLASLSTTHDVIGVTINYRLGILGFLSLGNEVARGNYGLWDQVMALQWIKDNIKAFGGDPDDITLSGESAGGASVGYLSMSPVTKGLFSKAFLQSGTATSVFGQAIDVKKNTLHVVKLGKCWDGEITEYDLDVGQSKAVINCLKNADLSVFTSFTDFTLSGAKFVPAVDGEILPQRPSLLMNDESYLESVGFYERSYLVSMVNNEFAIMHNFLENGMHDKKKETILKLGDDIRNFYIKSRLNVETVSSSTVENIMDFYARRMVGDNALIGMLDDLSFLLPTYDLLNAASNQRKCKSWFLFFDHFPAFQKGQYKGTVHTADLLFWHDISVADFENLVHLGMAGEMDDNDLRLKSLFSSVIADFMKHGDPGLALKDMLPSGWPTYERDNAYYVNFNLEPTLRTHLKRDNRDLWMKKVFKWIETTPKHTEL